MDNRSRLISMSSEEVDPAMEVQRNLIREVEGVNIPVFFSEECFRSALKFRAGQGDIFVVTYPKCGTTWMQNLVLNILRRGEPLQHPLHFYLATPFLDQLGAEDSERLMIKPGCYKSHLPLRKVPWSNDSKYIYVARNPKDCCVSFYHHMKTLPQYQFSEADFDEFLQLFTEGNVEFGNYFDHVIPWYDTRHSPNVFFTTFEKMKENLREVALKVAAFIDKDEPKFLSRNPAVLEQILRHCSFDVMKAFVNKGLFLLYNVKDEAFISQLPKGRRHIIHYNSSLPRTQDGKTLNFIRSGKVGSWRELRKDQIQTLDEMIEKHTKNSDIMSLWEEAC